MTRFIKQTDKYSCSAVAYINLMKFLGYDYTAKDLNEVKTYLGTNKKIGTLSYMTENMLQLALECVDIDINKKNKLTLKDIDEELRNGNVILFTTFHKGRGHDALIIDRTPTEYKCINFYSGETISFIGRKKMSKILKEKGPHREISSGLIIEVPKNKH